VLVFSFLGQHSFYFCAGHYFIVVNASVNNINSRLCVFACDAKRERRFFFFFGGGGVDLSIYGYMEGSIYGYWFHFLKNFDQSL
jgi:hypothetical protein